MKDEDRARRQEIIEALINFGILGAAEAVQISDTIFQPSYNATVGSSPRCKGFILVNNFLRFPSYMKLSSCFVDYLNYRCQSGEILSKLLARKVCCASLSLSPDEPAQLEQQGADAEKNVFDLVQKGDFFYSFCLGKVVSLEDFDHCTGCHVCFEHSYWICKRCGASTAR